MAREPGATLREAREAKGIELSEVHRVLKIRREYLRAMEEDRWGDLPGHAYARGFLATYAHYLGLDHHELVEAYEAGPGSGDDVAPIPPDMLPQRGQIRHRRRLRLPRVPLAALALLALAGVMAYGLLRDPDPEPQTPDAGARTDAATAPTAEAGGGAPESGSEPESPAVDGGADQDSGNEPAADRTRIRVKATGSVWVCMVEDGRRPLIDGEVLVAGETRGPFETNPGEVVEIGLGNGAIEITVDGEPVGVPNAPDPVGYRIRDGRARELGPTQRPECT